MLRRSVAGGDSPMISLQPLGQSWRLLLLMAAVTTVSATAFAFLAPTTYRSESAIRFSGSNLGSPDADADQARLAARNDPAIAGRTLDVTEIPGLGLSEFQQQTELETAPDGVLEIAIENQSADSAHALCAEFTDQLASDQNGTIDAAASEATKVQPRPLETAILGLAAGIVLGVALALTRDALRARDSG